MFEEKSSRGQGQGASQFLCGLDFSLSPLTRGEGTGFGTFPVGVQKLILICIQ
jgi:hypothetical protein